MAKKKKSVKKRPASTSKGKNHKKKKKSKDDLFGGLTVKDINDFLVEVHSPCYTYPGYPGCYP